MAQSRPPPVRVHTTTGASPPPLSPRPHNSSNNNNGGSDKKHHVRRKSAKTDFASEKRSSRPSTLSRKTTPQHQHQHQHSHHHHNHQHSMTKTSSSSGRTHRDRDRDDEERRRDSGETFPQFCMNCEKQFFPADNTFLYCTESCRLHDNAPAPPLRTQSYPSYNPSTASPPLTPFSDRHFPNHEDGPDIIPRFSPTQSRPRSYFSNDPYPSSSSYAPPSSHTLSSSTPHHVYSATHSSSALESLRGLATALPKTKSASRKGSGSNRNSVVAGADPESPPQSISRSGSTVWAYMPFTSSSSSRQHTPSVTPGSSYTGTGSNAPAYGIQSQQQAYHVTTYGGLGGGRSREDLYTYGNGQHASGAYGNTGGMGMDRPLPPRSGPGGYGHRPKSIDLVTPFGAV